ncbi:SDR family NAD(P)-dependent oxidoreductase [Aliarcobacter skirrowii]|uniref:SDR family NAD(P)-dependent oxidoreductase n=1 Tax=Aliarcobacter skirrowii TaxID=28200 RepID=UPI0021B340DA|nr:SDR family NAD(P)-dependent oxidoreductase [Aliarcobacter skirrowii]MCT7446694.1 SDR family NAD(P)-dependent oxidoreductase [Aliarcobacter skirrowii]
MCFENKVVFITGANGGLAKSFIEALLKENAKKIYCTARDLSKLEELKKLSPKIEIFALDITKKDELEKVASKIENIDILINNAGVNSQKRVIDDNKIDFEVNLFGTLNSCQILSKKLNKNGSIVNITSILALINLPIMGLYCASKSALHSITQAFRAELQKENIKVFEVLPGPIDTNMTKGQDMPKSSTSAIVEAVLEGIKNSELEIYPDDFSQMVKQRLQNDKDSLEKEFLNSL